jgi:hypothetical protein
MFHGATCLEAQITAPRRIVWARRILGEVFKRGARARKDSAGTRTDRSA